MDINWVQLSTKKYANKEAEDSAMNVEKKNT